MPVFLVVVLIALIADYVFLYFQFAQRMPGGNSEVVVFGLLPIVLFTVGVLIALIYMGIQLNYIMKLVDDRRR